jgi:flagella basal body P-ring formation protein FlgA
MRPYLAALWVTLAVAQPADAATLRLMVTLQDAVVRLSDLFDDAGVDANKVLGPGPAPGSRIVVEAGQLEAIARQFGVDWRAASPSDRVIIDRPGRTLPRQDVLAALRSSLEGSGYTHYSEIELPGFNPPLVAAETDAQVTVEQMNLDPGGNFSSLIAVFSQGLPPQKLRVTGRVEETLEVPVATRRLLPGTLLRPDDVRMARLRAGLIQTEVALNTEDVVGRVVRHLSVPGQPFPVVDLGRQAVVLRGSRVTLSLQSDGLDLTAQGIATESGGVGDQISIRNPLSGAMVQAEVTGPGAARVAPGSLPLTPAQRGTPPVVAVR